MANNDQETTSHNLTPNSFGHPRTEAANNDSTLEMQVDEPQPPAQTVRSEPSESTQLAGTSSASLEQRTCALSLADPPLQAPDSNMESPENPSEDDSMPPLIPVSDDEDAETPPAMERPPTRQQNSRRARVEDSEDEDEQRQTNRQRMTSPNSGDALDAEHHFHPDMHTHAQEREQSRQGGPPPQPSADRVRHMAFAVDWVPFTVSVIPIIRASGDNARVPPPPPYELDPPQATFLPTDAAPAQQQQDAQPNAGATQIPQGDRLATDFAHFMDHLRDMIGRISVGPDGTPTNLPPGVHINPAPTLFPFEFQETEDPARAMKLMKGLEEVPPGLLKRMEKVGEQDSEMPVCAVCFDSLLQPAEGAGDVPMDVDSESTASNDPAISSTASTSGSSTASSAETVTPVDTSLDKKVFVLPCAHAFHGACLRPWFTRPHRTTCPTCRFDIDPESLTYVAPPPGERFAQMDWVRQMLNRRMRPQATNTAARAPAEAANTNPSQPGDIPPQQPPLTPAGRANIPGSTSAPQLNVPPPALPIFIAAAGNHHPGDAPISIIFDISIPFFAPPGARPPVPAPVQAETTEPQNAQNAQAQDQPAPQATQGHPVINRQMIEQIVRGMLGALAGANGPAPPPPAPAAPHERANSPPPPAPRASSEPPMSSTTRTPSPPPPFLGSLGGGPLPALGTIPLGAQGPLPSFTEFVQFIDGLPLPQEMHGQPGVDAGAPQAQPPQGPLPPPLGQRTPRPSNAPPPVPNERGRSPGFGGFMQNIGNLATNAFHNLFTVRPPDGTGAPPPPTGAANAPTRPPQPPGPIPLHVPLHRHRAPNAPPEPKKDWALPPPPGLTLRERVERRERDLGLRCSDISCGLGPTDEDPVPIVDPRSVRQIHIKPLKSAAAEHHGSDAEKVCEHSFHPACLVSAERVAGWNGADQKEDPQADEGEVQVSCPVCRAVGAISKEDWDEGACALV